MTPSMSVIESLTNDRLGKTPSRVFLYNNYDLTDGSVLLFLFDQTSTTPFAVLKLARNRSILIREYENLNTIDSICPGLAAAPLFFDQAADYYVLGTAPLIANRLSGYRARSRKLKRVSARLAKLHELLRSQSPSTMFQVEHFMRPFAGLYDTELPVTVADFFNDLAAVHAQLIRQFPVEEISQHGDLYFDNILAKGRRVYFLDWEDFGEIKLPGYDLFSLVFDVCGLQDGAVAQLEELIDSVAGKTVNYFRKLGIPSGVVEALISFTLVQQYHRSWTLGRTSKESFARRLVNLEANRDLFPYMSNAFCMRL